MPSFSQCIVQTCATASSKIHCQRRGFQRLCGLVTVVILICTFYLFKDKDQQQITLKDTTPNRSIIEAQSKAITTASLYRTTFREALVIEHLLNVSTLSHHGEEEEKEEEEEEEARRECQPGHNVIMIKTHKSGSSTLQNILLRMAENNHLRVALPKEGVYLNDFQRFQRDVIYRDDGMKKYNVMASHMKVTASDFPAITGLMENGTKWLSVMRNPVKQFESLYTYYGWHNNFHVGLHDFLKYPVNYFAPFHTSTGRVSSRNPMCYDNGLDARFLEAGNPAVERFISLLDSQLDLVLIADYFDESLVLLKDILCWSLEDVAYMVSNSRIKESIVELTPKEEQAIKEWNWADQLLYQHFNRTLHEKIDAFGRDKMVEEVGKLQRLKESLKADCVREKLTSGDKRVWYPQGVKVNSFIANPDARDPYLCSQLCRPELEYLDKMRRIMDAGDGRDRSNQQAVSSSKDNKSNNVQSPNKEESLAAVIVLPKTVDSGIKSTDTGNETRSQIVLEGKERGVNGVSEGGAGLPKADVRSNRSTELGTKELQSKSCMPLDRVVMIKTHKCSSSTLQNILLRRGEDRDVSIAIPMEGVYFSQVYPFNRRFIFMDDGKRKYDIMASHMKFDLGKFQDLKNVMNAGTKYLTILRDPAEQYESMYTYYGYPGRFGADLHTFLLHPDLYFANREQRQSLQAGRNPMCQDNGFDARFVKPGDTSAEMFISALDKWHDLVLIADHFDESLILLKDMMCWELDDVAYLKQNARSKDSVVSLTGVEREAIRRWNWADTLLYEHFNRTLWERVAAYGNERMAKDVAALRDRNEELSKDCVSRTMDRSDPRMWYPAGIKVNSFQLNDKAKNPHLCSQLTLPELKYLQKLRSRRSERG